MPKRTTRNPIEKGHGISFVTGGNWGDEGKGKLIDVLAQNVDMVIRTNGGANAGHTVNNQFGKFALHLIPSGIFHTKVKNILANTTVIDPIQLAQEITEIRKAGVAISAKNLLIAQDAQVVFPWHKIRDRLREATRGKQKVGTTGRGIGPAYADHTERTGLQMQHLIDKDFPSLFNKELEKQKRVIQALAETKEHLLHGKEILSELQTATTILKPLIQDVMPVISDYYDKGRKILGEAGQGILLDLDRGTYPYVTSSHPGIAGFNLAAGISPYDVTRSIGVIKAYSTRVGEGPMPTELFDSIGERLREKGHEYGATTGRPRRCGWLDMVATKYAIKTGGLTSLALMKLDIFDEFEEINICVGYTVGTTRYHRWPTAENEFLTKAKPVYETLPGWKKTTLEARSLKALPKEARNFIHRVEEVASIPIEVISVGPHRDATIYPYS